MVFWFCKGNNGKWWIKHGVLARCLDFEYSYKSLVLLVTWGFGSMENGIGIYFGGGISLNENTDSETNWWGTLVEVLLVITRIDGIGCLKSPAFFQLSLFICIVSNAVWLPDNIDEDEDTTAWSIYLTDNRVNPPNTIRKMVAWITQTITVDFFLKTATLDYGRAWYYARPAGFSLYFKHLGAVCKSQEAQGFGKWSKGESNCLMRNSFNSKRIN